MGDRYRLQFQVYQRPFRQPLHTSHGVWRVREGIIISIADSLGNIGKGEIAPLTWFGSETLSEAVAFCRSLSTSVSQKDITSIPDTLPACQFAFESAWTSLQAIVRPDEDDRSWNYSYLLPAGTKALTAWQEISSNVDLTDSKSISTFKWKIGVEPITEEIAIFRQLIQVLPANAQLRLDANGGLNLAQARQWLATTAKLDRVEFIEQPLPPSQLNLMFALQQDYPTPIALDESVANFKDLERCYRQGWQGIFVVKPAILGFPSRLCQFCRQNRLDLVFSSVFETEIGRQAVLRLARELTDKKYIIQNRPLGFGVDFWF